MAIDPQGDQRIITDQLGAFEVANNPDSVTHYGLTEPAPACEEALAPVPFIPPAYTGQIDSHPYGLAVHGNTAYMAEAGGNRVLAVNLTTGAISSVAVLPAVPTTITAELAGSLEATLEGFGIFVELDACVGVTYGFEPVPTDVAVGPDGWLYVATLPGGPEDPSAGARGAVFRVNPITGEVQEWVTGLAGPTGIVFDGSGNLYIAALFGGAIYRVPAGSQTAEIFLEVPSPADVTVRGSTLYATTDVFGSGTLVSLTL